MSSPLSSPRQVSISRSVSPVSTISCSHSTDHGDNQTNGYQHIPYASQPDDGSGTTVKSHSPTAGRNAENRSAVHVTPPVPPVPSKYDTLVHTTDAEVDPPLSQSKDQPSGKTGKLQTIVGKFWLWEISAYCFSLACMGAVVGVLAYENGKPLDQWGFRITPNAVVSFIVTLAKSAFLVAITETISQLKWIHFHDKSHKLSDLRLFDEASRGPFGSLKLLVARHRIHYSPLALQVLCLQLHLLIPSCSLS